MSLWHDFLYFLKFSPLLLQLKQYREGHSLPMWSVETHFQHNFGCPGKKSCTKSGLNLRKYRKSCHRDIRITCRLSWTLSGYRDWLNVLRHERAVPYCFNRSAMSLSLSSHGVSRIVTKVNEVPTRRPKKDGRLWGGIAALLKNICFLCENNFHRSKWKRWIHF